MTLPQGRKPLVVATRLAADVEQLQRELANRPSEPGALEWVALPRSLKPSSLAADDCRQELERLREECATEQQKREAR